MQWSQKNLGYLITSVLASVPVFVWITQLPLSSRFETPTLTFISLSQITGLVGIVLFSISLILSSRFKITELLFGGLNRVYIAHHQIGGLGFILLLIHPLLIAFSYIPISTKAAILQLLPVNGLGQNLGVASLFLLMSLMIFTYYIKFPYQTWRLTHKFLGVAFWLGGVHATLVGSTISTSPFLKSYLLTLNALAIISYFYRTVLGRFFVKRYSYIVDTVSQLGHNIVELSLSPKNQKLAYKPGQFLFISFPKLKKYSEVHPFSISSGPQKPVINLSIKNLGDYTSALSSLPLGTEASLEGPYGKFTYSLYQNKNQVWIAGGIGITPFLSMAQSLQPEYNIKLFYCVNKPEEAVYLNSLKVLATKSPNLNIYPHYSNTDGRISIDYLKSKLKEEFVGPDYFICGPPAMMSSLKLQLKKAGVSGHSIHTEEFSIN